MSMENQLHKRMKSTKMMETRRTKRKKSRLTSNRKRKRKKKKNRTRNTIRITIIRQMMKITATMSHQRKMMTLDSSAGSANPASLNQITRLKAESFEVNTAQ